MSEQGHKPLDQVEPMVDVLHVVGELGVEEVQQAGHQNRRVLEIQMTCGRIQEVAAVLLKHVPEHLGKEFYKFTVVGLEAHDIQ